MLALALVARTTTMCWDFTDVRMVVADVAGVRVRLVVPARLRSASRRECWPYE